jgi:N-acetylmuramoyl-L-alanine amidase
MHGSITRRTMLGMIGITGLGLLTGCEENRQGAMQLPDPLSPLSLPKKAPIPDKDYAPPPDSKPLPPPVTTKPPANNFDIIPRSAWAREGPKMSTVDPMNGVRLITFHHSGDPKPFTTTDYAETAQHLESVREYHRSRNFQDIGYHFAIDRAGRVWQLRSLAYEGQHARSHNEHNIGIVVLGNFDRQALSQAQRDKIKSFGLLVRKQYNLSAARIVTHQELVSTECPGDNMQPYMVEIRKKGLV